MRVFKHSCSNVGWLHHSIFSVLGLVQIRFSQPFPPGVQLPPILFAVSYSCPRALLATGFKSWDEFVPPITTLIMLAYRLTEMFSCYGESVCVHIG